MLSIRKNKKSGLGECDPRNRLAVVAYNRIHVKDAKSCRIRDKLRHHFRSSRWKRYQEPCTLLIHQRYAVSFTGSRGGGAPAQHTKGQPRVSCCDNNENDIRVPALLNPPLEPAPLIENVLHRLLSSRPSAPSGPHSEGRPCADGRCPRRSLCSCLRPAFHPNFTPKPPSRSSTGPHSLPSPSQATRTPPAPA